MGKEEEIEEIIERSEVKFAIRNYDDIFSDFDPRPLHQRGLSEDFLQEAKRAVNVKEGKRIDFIFIVPKKERDLKAEQNIAKRLKEYFNKHSSIIENERKKMVKRGIWFTTLGVVLMLIATYLLFQFKSENLIANFFTILFEPAGWFIFWHGLDDVLFEPRETDPDLDFHKKMANANIRFISV